jgi:glycosyltransferase involved in cell wall biosynthesis
MAALMAVLMRVRFSVSAHAWDITASPSAVLRRRLQEAAFVSVCTEQGKEALGAKGITGRLVPLKVVRHGLYPEEYPEAERTGHRILAVGRLVPKKGFIYLLNACDILKRRGMSFTCTIAGEGTQRPELERMIAALGLSDVVELAGEIESAAVSELLTTGALFVLPSVCTPEQDRDGLSNAVLEAMAAGLPVVTTTGGAAGELVRDGENGCLVPEQDAAQLAARIAQLLEQKDLRDRIGRAARNTIRAEADIRGHIKELIGLFERAVRREG